MLTATTPLASASSFSPVALPGVSETLVTKLANTFSFPPTEEQWRIISAALTLPDSILINALAGAAKTTTLELLAAALPVEPTLCLAFNKRIEVEMTKRMPGHFQCRTLNSLGHRVWAQATGKRLVLNKDKTTELLRLATDDLSREEKKAFREVWSDVRRAISTAKLSGYIPDGTHSHAKRLIQAEDFYAYLDEEVADWQHIIDAVLIRSIELSYEGTIDFDDQIYMPTLFGGPFPKFPRVIIDEAQDLSALNHEMLRKLVTKRLIAVGDPWQSIYGFRGAVSNGMARLQQQYSMHEMTLSVSFRCPRAGVLRAHSRVPHMRWAPGAKEGRVEHLPEWSSKEIPDNAAILCRNNAPLFSLALALLRSGRGCQLVGSDLGPSLLRTLKKLGDPDLTQEQTHVAINRWEAERLAKSRSKAAIADKAECLHVFAAFGDTLGAAIAYAEHLFSASGPIQLLSGHKAKGLEWDVVFHLDPWRVPSKFAESPEDREQELNVRYVIETRFKDTLFLVNMDDFNE